MKHYKDIAPGVTFLMILVIGIWFFYTPKKAKPLRVKAPKPITCKSMGIDISHHQGDIDWNKVDSFRNKEISFVYIKATEGSSFKDEDYDKNIQAARNKGILVGSYHFFKTTSKAQNQFNNFISKTDKYEQDLIPMIDIEERGTLNEERFHLTLSKFLILVEDHFGRKPLLYASNDFHRQYLEKHYKNYYFCIARYGGLKPDLTTWTMWQFTEKGKLDGFSELVDVSILNDSTDISILEL
jgi:lysozyme